MYKTTRGKKKANGNENKYVNRVNIYEKKINKSTNIKEKRLLDTKFKVKEKFYSISESK